MGEIFGAIESGLGSALAFLYDLVPSFGFSIILLTVGINLILFPLTLKQTRATRAFQEIQPEIKRIQKELKDTPEEMQKELMRVQREAGATPLGCLFPMLVQFPIWWALFRVLRSANAAAITDGSSFIPPSSDLAKAILGGTQRFLGMDLGTTMSDGILIFKIDGRPTPRLEESPGPEPEAKPRSPQPGSKKRKRRRRK